MAREIFNTPLQDEFFKILGEDYNITILKLSELFSRNKEGIVKFNTSDIIKIGPQHSPYVNSESYTTTGIFIYNKVCIEKLEIFGYINRTIKGSLVKKIDEKIADALLCGDLKPEQVSQYIDSCQYLFGGPLAHIINPSLSLNILKLPDSSRKLKEKLIAENIDELKKGNPMVASKIEKQVCEHAMIELRKANDPAMDIFDSECGVDFNNNFKTMFVMKGAVKDNTNGTDSKYNVALSDYDNGVSQEDFPYLADSMVLGAYSKGKLTAIGGYSTKKYNAMYQNVSLDEKGSDCGTKKTKKIRITEENKKAWGKYHYIMEKGKYVLLTPDNISSYIGKEVDMRVPIHCEHKDPKYCNICYGDMPYMLDITNVGLTFSIMSNAQLNNNMKKFHDITIKVYQIDIEKDLMSFINKKA